MRRESKRRSEGRRETDCRWRAAACGGVGRATSILPVIEPLADMPPGTIGFRATGRVTREDYHAVLVPPLRAAAEAGDVRLLFAVGPGFEKLESGALAEDAKVGLALGIGHHEAWKRTAVPTDVDWIAKALRMFAWLTPGEVKAYPLEELEAAKAWVAG